MIWVPGLRKPTFLGVLKRARVLFGDRDMGGHLENVYGELKKEALSHPLVAGEALRCWGNPDEAYGVLRFPSSWRQRRHLWPHLSLPPCFVFDYHFEKEEVWSLCSLSGCEESGVGEASFLEALRKKAPLDIKQKDL